MGNKTLCRPWDRIKDVIGHAYTDFINEPYLAEAEDNQNGVHVIVKFNEKGNIVIGIEV